jgi:hypothetical protein
MAGLKRGGMAPINGGNEGELDVTIFLFRWRRGGDRGGGMRPVGGGAVLGFGAGGRRRPVPVGP